jgi:hypothetical protein
METRRKLEKLLSNSYYGGENTITDLAHQGISCDVGEPLGFLMHGTRNPSPLISGHATFS